MKPEPHWAVTKYLQRQREFAEICTKNEKKAGKILSIVSDQFEDINNPDLDCPPDPVTVADTMAAALAAMTVGINNALYKQTEMWACDSIYKCHMHHVRYSREWAKKHPSC